MARFLFDYCFFLLNEKIEKKGVGFCFIYFNRQYTHHDIMYNILYAKSKNFQMIFQKLFRLKEDSLISIL